jgi:hypothetical protein
MFAILETLAKASPDDGDNDKPKARRKPIPFSVR